MPPNVHIYTWPPNGSLMEKEKLRKLGDFYLLHSASSYNIDVNNELST